MGCLSTALEQQRPFAITKKAIKRVEKEEEQQEIDQNSAKRGNEGGKREEIKVDMKPQPPVMIAVMGKTGTGKTSFVNAITEKGLIVGHELDSCEYSPSTTSPFIYSKDTLSN